MFQITLKFRFSKFLPFRNSKFSLDIPVCSIGCVLRKNIVVFYIKVLGRIFLFTFLLIKLFCQFFEWSKYVSTFSIYNRLTLHCTTKHVLNKPHYLAVLATNNPQFTHNYYSKKVSIRLTTKLPRGKSFKRVYHHLVSKKDVALGIVLCWMFYFHEVGSSQPNKLLKIFKRGQLSETDRGSYWSSRKPPTAVNEWPQKPSWTVLCKSYFQYANFYTPSTRSLFFYSVNASVSR